MGSIFLLAGMMSLSETCTTPKSNIILLGPIREQGPDKVQKKNATRPQLLFFSESLSLYHHPKTMLKNSKRAKSRNITTDSGQIIIFHQPRFPWNKGISLPQLPFGVRSFEVAIIWSDRCRVAFFHPTPLLLLRCSARRNTLDTGTLYHRDCPGGWAKAVQRHGGANIEGKTDPTWRIIPVSKWLIAMVNKSPKDRLVPLISGRTLWLKWGWSDQLLTIRGVPSSK